MKSGKSNISPCNLLPKLLTIFIRLKTKNAFNSYKKTDHSSLSDYDSKIVVDFIENLIKVIFIRVSVANTIQSGYSSMYLDKIDIVQQRKTVIDTKQLLFVQYSVERQRMPYYCFKLEENQWHFLYVILKSLFHIRPCSCTKKDRYNQCWRTDGAYSSSFPM